MSGSRLALSGDTIVAPASGRGRAALSVVRISGPAAVSVLDTMAGGAPPPRRMTLRGLRDNAGDLLDRALVVWLPGPASFTGEDMAELFVHGGTAVLSAVLRATVSVPRVRLAEPGEFTRRAVLNGKLDLAEAEALGDLIDAETQAQRRQALRHLDGVLGRSVDRWREEVVDALALIEADLDFSDEGDVSGDLVEEALGRARIVHDEIATELADRRGERLREGFVVVIAGPPNAGKSTLLNHLAKRDVAIVSPHPGTTRDAVEVRCDIGGYPVLLVDTAGIRDTHDPVEVEGVSRAEGRMKEADLVLWLDPLDEPARANPSDSGPSLAVRTKADLVHARPGGNGLAVSATTGVGIDSLLATLEHRIKAAAGGDAALVTRERHRQALGAALAALSRAIDAGAKSPELLAEDLRVSATMIGQITGHVGADDVLDRIFSAFCIGK